MNRVGPPREFLGDPAVNYAPGSTTSSGPVPSNTNSNPGVVNNNSSNVAPAAGTPVQRRGPRKIDSKVWI